FGLTFMKATFDPSRPRDRAKGNSMRRRMTRPHLTGALRFLLEMTRSAPHPLTIGGADSVWQWNEVHAGAPPFLFRLQERTPATKPMVYSACVAVSPPTS